VKMRGRCWGVQPIESDGEQVLHFLAPLFSNLLAGSSRNDPLFDKRGSIALQKFGTRTTIGSKKSITSV
jgi:hypothetical protein